MKRLRATISPACERSAPKSGRVRRQITALALGVAMVLPFASAVYAQSAPPLTASTTQNTPVTVTESGTNLYGLTAPADGTATYAGGINQTANVPGSVTYTPNNGFFGTDSFTYEYCFLAFSGRGSCRIKTMTVSVGLRAAPTANNGSITTAYDTAGSTTLTSASVIASYAVATNPTHGSVSISGSTATYVPTTGYYGADSFTFTVTGPSGTSAPATISVSVGLPPAPTVANGAINTPYNTAGATTLAASGVVSGYVIASIPAHGSVSLAGGAVTYTPTSGFYGSDNFTFYAIGPGGNSGVGTIIVSVGDPPAPTVANGAISTPYNTAATVTLPGSGVISGYGVVASPSHGAAAISGSSVTYTPASGYYGSDSFTYYAAGPGGNSAAATITVTVGDPPAPTASNGSLTTAYNTAGSVTLPASGVISSYAVVAPPAHGAVSLSGAAATYTPTPGYYGADSFTFNVTGPGGTSGVATITVTVGDPPAPTASNGSIITPYNTAGSTTLMASGVVASYALVTAPSHGAAVITGGTAVYTPNAGYYGSDSFTFRAIGPGGNSAAATITVTVGNPPAPTASNGAISTPYNTAGSTTLTAAGVVTGYAVVSGPSHGATVISGGTAVFTPNAGFYGLDSFTFRATGPGGSSAAATISVSVGNPPAPTASNGAITTPYNTPATTTLPSSGIVTSYAIDANPAHGAVSLSGSAVTYTPAAGYYGPDSFTFNVAGPGGVSQVATISVTVQTPPPPVANSAPLACAYQTACPITLTSTGVTTTYAPDTPATNGTCTIVGDTLTYTPAWGAVGSDSCTFTAAGPGGVSAPATIYVTNEPPPLPEGSGSSTGTPIPSSGASVALCLAGQSASIPGLPGPPTGTSYDPNWCNEQALTIVQQALQLQNQLSQIANLQSQVTAAQQMLQKLGSDSTSAPLAAVNAQLASVLQQATGIGFNSRAAGSNFGAAYPATATTAGFNGAQLTSALQTWQANTAQALSTSIAVQNKIAQTSPTITSAVQDAVTRSNAAVGATAAHQATNQVIAAVSAQLAQLQDILITESQAYAAVEAAKQQAAAAAAAVTTQTGAQVPAHLTTAPGVDDTSHM